MTPSRPPSHLGPDGRAFYRKITQEWEQADHEALLLIAACEQIDIVTACRENIAADGLQITTAKGVQKENPAAATMRQATRLIQSLVRQMDLTEDPQEAYRGRVRPHRHRKP